MSNSTWKSWKLNELSAKSFQEELSDASIIKAQLEQSVFEFEERVKLFELDKSSLFTLAKEEGFTTGKDEGFTLGFEEGYQLGKSLAIEEYEKSLSIKLKNIADFCENLNEFVDLLKSRAPNHLSNILRTSLKKLFLDVNFDSTTYLTSLISEEINKLDTVYNEIKLKVSSGDYEEIQKNFAGIFQSRGWKIIIDPSLTNGGFVLESNDFEIDGSVERRLSKVFELIDQLGDK